jgi:ADP-heptose:LPS heptosyltransferase
MKCLCTFPADFGDVIWSLATVKALSSQMACKFDFCCGDVCESLIPLIGAQSYIDTAFFVKGWPEVIEIQTGVMMSNRTWELPAEHCSQYDTVFNLGYQDFPNKQVIDFIAEQQRITLQDPLPFLDVADTKLNSDTIAVGFNSSKEAFTDVFIEQVRETVFGYNFQDVTKMPWLEAASCIKNAKGFVGSRSSNCALAYGVGQQNIFLYEPSLERHDDIWGCDYIDAAMAPIDLTPEEAAEMAASKIKGWKVTA